MPSLLGSDLRYSFHPTPPVGSRGSICPHRGFATKKAHFASGAPFAGYDVFFCPAISLGAKQKNKQRLSAFGLLKKEIGQVGRWPSRSLGFGPSVCRILGDQLLPGDLILAVGDASCLKGPLAPALREPIGVLELQVVRASQNERLGRVSLFSYVDLRVFNILFRVFQAKHREQAERARKSAKICTWPH